MPRRSKFKNFFSRIAKGLKEVITQTVTTESGVSLSRKEVKRREKLIKESQKQFREKAKNNQMPFKTEDLATTQETAFEHYMNTRHRERQSGIPTTKIPKSVKSTEDLKKFNDKLEGMIRKTVTLEKTKIYRENLVTAMGKVFSSDEFEVLKDKLDNISDERLHKSLLEYGALDIDYVYTQEDRERKYHNLYNTFHDMTL